MERRKFLKQAGLSGAALFISPIMNASMPLFPSTKIDALKTIEQSDSIKWVGLDVPEVISGGYKKFPIKATIEGNKISDHVGDFFTIEESAKFPPKADILGNDQHQEYFKNGVNFEKIAQDYKSFGKIPSLIVAAAYTHDWKKANDMVLSYGETIGAQEVENYKGLVVIKENGIPEILHIDDLSTDLKTFTETKSKPNNWSQFQQIMIIRDGNVIFNPQNDNYFSWRFLAERKSNGVSTKGVVNLKVEMPLSLAIEVLKKLERPGTSKIENAVLLDTGAVEEGYYFDKKKKKLPLINQPRVNRDKFTNVIVFYS